MDGEGDKKRSLLITEEPGHMEEGMEGLLLFKIIMDGEEDNNKLSSITGMEWIKS